MSKPVLRAHFNLHRGDLSAHEIRERNESLNVRIADADVRVMVPGATIAAYVPVGAEPGSLDMLDFLRGSRIRVLLPVVDPGAPGPLNWAEYTGRENLTPGRFDIPEPRGRRLGADAIVSAAAILMPALAIDHHGHRLGKGAGHYDRSVGRSTALRIGVVYDEELVPELPFDDHDLAVDMALTPLRGFVALGAAPPA